MVVNDDAQESRDGFAPLHRVQERSWGKVRHPQVVDKGRLEALGGPAQRLTQLLAASSGMELMVTQQPVNRVEGGQLGILLAPAPVKDFDRHGQMSLGLL